MKAFKFIDNCGNEMYFLNKEICQIKLSAIKEYYASHELYTLWVIRDKKEYITNGKIIASFEEITIN